MGQKIAKKEPERGARLYDEQRFEEAIEEFKLCLTRKPKSSEEFLLYGQICRCYLDIGKTGEALDFANKQMEQANQSNDNSMKSEAFFHLAVCNELIGEFSKSISFCRNSLQIDETQNQLKAYLYLCLGNSYVGLSEFPKAWKSYYTALSIAHTNGDKLIEILVNTRLGILFTSLNDYDGGIDYCSKAWDLVNDIKESDPNIKYRRLVGVSLAVPYRKTGRYKDCTDLCEDAMKVAMLYGDTVVQVRCMVLFADIHRRRGDNERALPRYESALSLMERIGDRVGQVDALLGMSKTHTNLLKPQKAIELALKALEIAQKVGNKLQMLRCHSSLKSLYFDTRETTLSSRHHTLMKQLAEETDLYCGMCDDMMGQQPERLSVLICGHFIHGRCSSAKSESRQFCAICKKKPVTNLSSAAIDG
ncbi:43 kDa receptor-associated protein of the synapse [Patella vulgata]|uniref:43 kDa receptor-associated protein of the synapse n=1 Tax=Patella vulgata TaxID=6465 RepID=UPI0021802824|nr:43 kDa receptor-associated protein of the synapse [Patella vulgata]